MQGVLISHFAEFIRHSDQSLNMLKSWVDKHSFNWMIFLVKAATVFWP